MKIKELKIKQNPIESWSEVFQNPRDVRVESFKTGTVNIDRRGTINTKHPNARDVKDEVQMILMVELKVNLKMNFFKSKMKISSFIWIIEK